MHCVNKEKDEGEEIQDFRVFFTSCVASFLEREDIKGSLVNWFGLC